MVSASQNPSIFVHIAAYRDPELLLTLRDLYSKAEHPDNIYVGVCWQYDPLKGETPLQAPVSNGQVRVVNCLASESQGVGWARYRAQKLYAGETYALQIDCHTRFAQHWDSFLLTQWQQCDDTQAIVSCLPAAYDQASGDLKAAVANRLSPKRFKENGLLELQTVFLKELPAKPVHAVFASPKFIFAPAKLLTDVPSDPAVYFNEEEVSLSLRIWSHGWNVYTPIYPPLYHSFNTTGKKRPLHWEDNSNWSKLQQQALNHYLELLSGAGTNRQSIFGLGRSRSRHSFMAFCGVDLANKKLNPPSDSAGQWAISTSIEAVTAQAVTPPASKQTTPLKTAQQPPPADIASQTTADQVIPPTATPKSMAQAEAPVALEPETHHSAAPSETSQSVPAPSIQVKKLTSLEELVEPTAPSTEKQPPVATPSVQVKKLTSLEELVEPTAPSAEKQPPAATPSVQVRKLTSLEELVEPTAPSAGKQPSASAPSVQVRKLTSLEELVNPANTAQSSAQTLQSGVSQTGTLPAITQISAPATTAPKTGPVPSEKGTFSSESPAQTPQTPDYSVHPDQSESLSLPPQQPKVKLQIPSANCQLPMATGLNPGDFIPYFRLHDQDGQLREVHTCAGSWTLLICLPQENRAMLSRLTILKSAWEHLHRRGLQVVAIAANPSAILKQFHQQYQLPFALWSDPENTVSRLLGSYDTNRQAIEPCCYTLTPNLRIQKQYPFRNSAAVIGQILADVPHPAPLPGQIITMHAPVLTVPDVLTLEQCQCLAQQWQSPNNSHSPQTIAPESAKSNTDIVLQEPMMAEVDYILGGTLFPEIEKVFGLKVTHREEYKISRYDTSERRAYKQQRANFERQLAHRRMALFLNLNDDYDGGGLNFPEYGNFVYKPIAGDAIIFPCSLMHQRLPVTLGHQLTMNSFFFGESEMRHRLEFTHDADTTFPTNQHRLLAASKIQLQGQENVRSRYSYDQQ